jgi:hypothetical protein
MQSEILVSNFSNQKMRQEFREFFNVFLLLGPSPGHVTKSLQKLVAGPKKSQKVINHQQDCGC